MIVKLPKDFNPNEHEGKVLDSVGYSNALKESGYTDSEAREYWRYNSDPIVSGVNGIVNENAPKVGISGNKISISAPQSFFDSPASGQLKAELQVLKGADLENKEVQNVINKLNDEIRQNYSSALLEQSLGWTPEQYDDYQYALQTISVSNPMKSSNKIKGKDKDGNVVMKTPKEWEEYYRSAYNTDERNDAFLSSIQSTDPYERIMAILLLHGGQRPVYGFDIWERAGKAGEAAWNQLKKFPEGTFRTAIEDRFTKRIEQLGQKLGVSNDALSNAKITSEEQFDSMRDRVRGKAWGELSDDEKAFVIELNAFQERATDSGRKASKFKEIDKIAERDEDWQRRMIESIIDGGEDQRLYSNKSMFDRYKEVNNSYDTWRRYGEESSKLEERLAKNALWSESSQQLGSLAGTIARFLWEDAVLRGLTGGISSESLLNPKLVKGTTGGLSMNRISDDIGNLFLGSKELGLAPSKAGQRIMEALTKSGIAPASAKGQGVLRFAANLAGTIPEDIVQTAVDNVLTYNTEENTDILSGEEIGENLKRNLIWMSLFNAARAGWNSLKMARAAKRLAKTMDLNKPLDIEGLAADADDVARAISQEQTLETQNGETTITDADGNKKKIGNATPEEVEMAQMSVKAEVETDSPKAVGEGVDVETPKIDADDIARASGEGAPKVTVEVDTPDGVIRAEAPDYRPRTRAEAIELEVEPTPAGVRHAQDVQLKTIMDELPARVQEFHDKFGDVRATDFDWVWYKGRQNIPSDQIVGTVDPSTKRVITQNMIDAMEWWREQPFVKELRMASRGKLGLEGDFDRLGYLPHTVYDPTNMSFEEALPGQLWKTSTGASVLDDDGNYRGFGGTLEDRYRTFASNMLWDAKADAVATAKLVEEAMMEGRELTPELVEQSKRAVEGRRKIQSNVDNATGTKELNKALASDAEYDSSQWDDIDKNIKKDATKLGLGQAVHDNLADIYPMSNTQNVSSQLNRAATFDTAGNSMRKIVIGNGLSMYDGGAADIVYSTQNAIEMVGRWAREGGSWGDLRQMVVDYEMSHSGRPKKYAEKIADKWMAKIAEAPGPVTKAKLIKSLGSSMYWEGRTRLNRWLALSNYSQFNNATREFIDRFMLKHMQMDSVKNNKTVGQKLSKFMDGVTSYRYRALFYGNIRNALLQLSELNRLFTTFKWGDIAQTLKRLATDENFKARVDTYVEAVAPMTDRLKAELYHQYSNVADKMEVTQDGVTFKEMGKEAKEAADKIGLAPINTAEALKNRAMVAALVQEADRLGLSGDEALRHIRSRFERVALAQNEMGQIGLASSPIAKPMLFLQNFQIRELGMHWYNIKDLTGMEKSVPKRLINGFKYVSKVLGTKFATALILTRLGYSASQAMGLDPFGLLDNYNSLDEEDMEWADYFFKSPVFAGGMMSLISDLYFMARKAYEDSNQQTVSDEAEQRLGSSYGVDVPENLRTWPGALYDVLMGAAEAFGPGSALVKRISQAADMMDRGWAVSSTGNAMYSAPDNSLDTIMAYLFGRSATSNARQYNQTTGDNLSQTIGRFLSPLTGASSFDPIDTTNYTDWFKGDENDLQQFNKGKYWFQNERDKILDEYQAAIGKSYATDDEIAEAKNNMNRKLEELYDKLERFVAAYEKKNGTMTPAMTKQVLNILNTGRKIISDTPEQADERRWAELDKALERYSALGLSPVGTYTGPSALSPDTEIKYQGSPQSRAAVNGYYDAPDEAVMVLKLADEQLGPVRDKLKDRLSSAYAVSDWDSIKAIQKEYLEQFDQVVAPIVALYGNSILTNTNVANQLRDMLSTGTNKRSGNLIPSDQYTKNKYGRYQSMPYESVDVGEWASQRYSSDVYKKSTSRSYSTVDEDIAEIKRLASKGQNDRARARALQLKARVNSQTRALSKEEYKWLNEFLKGGK